jgi:hypothetical protein
MLARLTPLSLAFLVGCFEKDFVPLPEGTEPGDCTDSQDNDGNDVTDCDEDLCRSSLDCLMGPESDLAAVDNDNDGSTFEEDCNDSNADINPASDDSYGDGIDSNCDGTDGIDSDGDGFSVEGGDCNDDDSDINPAAQEIWYDDTDQDCSGGDDHDADNDGFTVEEDCNDNLPDFNSDSADPYGDGLDQNCDGIDGVDGDGDGYASLGTDCDDDDDDIYPGAVESCNEVDDDCDGETDEADSIDVEVWYMDSDSDGFGDPNATTEACTQPDGYVDDSADCNDDNGSANPDADEVCNDSDDDCDGETDEADADDAALWYQDYDLDGYGDDDSTTLACDEPLGYVAVGGDCRPGSASINPGADEVCNGIDDDCDDEIDSEDSSIQYDASERFYQDADADGYGYSENFEDACTQPDGYVTNSDDCSHLNPIINPDTIWYADNDSDGFGNSAIQVESCAAPDSMVLNNQDCNDQDSNINPDNTEICDSQQTDEDCNGLADDEDSGFDPSTGLGYVVDADGDGHGDIADDAMAIQACVQPTGYVLTEYADDCNDASADIHPDASEVCDDADTDEDCDGLIDEADDDIVFEIGQGLLFQDLDADGYGNLEVSTLSCEAMPAWVSDSQDCNDLDASVNPDTIWYADNDGDGHGNAALTSNSCEQPASFISNSSDCNDSDAAINPDASEVCDDLETDEDCDDLVDEEDDSLVSTLMYPDVDQDGFGVASDSIEGCDIAEGYADNSDDCDDGNPEINPSAIEYCDAIDNDCDDEIDGDDSNVDLSLLDTYYADFDGDGYGDPSDSVDSCSMPAGYIDNSDDCDDSSANLNLLITVYADLDNDGYGDNDSSQEMCFNSFAPNTTIKDGDCDDSDVQIHPLADESIGDGIDSNCDGYEENFDADCRSWIQDGDGTFDMSYLYCTSQHSWEEANTVCQDIGYSGLALLFTEEDSNAADLQLLELDELNPSYAPTAYSWIGFSDPTNSSDWIWADESSFTYSNFSASAETNPGECGVLGFNNDGWYTDACEANNTFICATTIIEDGDRDGYTTVEGDCDDTDSSLHPWAGYYEEDPTLCMFDEDGDGYGVDKTSNGIAAPGTDCNDVDATINPGIQEIPYNGIDSNCNASDEYDADGDGVTSSTESADGTTGNDCDDTDPDVYLFAPEISNDGVDSNCDGLEDLGYECDGDWDPLGSAYLLGCSNNSMEAIVAEEFCMESGYNGLATVGNASTNSLILSLNSNGGWLGYRGEPIGDDYEWIWTDQLVTGYENWDTGNGEPSAQCSGESQNGVPIEVGAGLCVVHSIYYASMNTNGTWESSLAESADHETPPEERTINCSYRCDIDDWSVSQCQ